MLADVSTSLADVINSSHTVKPPKRQLSKNRQIARRVTDAKGSSDDDMPLDKIRARAHQPRHPPLRYTQSPGAPESPDGSFNAAPALLSRRSSYASPLFSDADPPPDTTDGQATMTASVSSINDRPSTRNNSLTDGTITTVEGGALASGFLEVEKTTSIARNDLQIITSVASATVPSSTIPTTPPTSTGASTATTASTAPVPVKKVRTRGVPPGITARQRAQASGQIQTYSSQSSSKIRASGTAAAHTPLPRGIPVHTIPSKISTAPTSETSANAPPTQDELVVIQSAISELAAKVSAQEQQLLNRGREIKVLREKYEVLSDENQRLKARWDNVPTMVSFEVRKIIEEKLPGLHSSVHQAVLRVCQERVQQLCNGAMAPRNMNGDGHSEQSRVDPPPLPGPQGSPVQTVRSCSLHLCDLI